MIKPSTVRILLVLAAGTAALGAATARAGDPLGPRFGSNRFKGFIERGGEGIDTDDFVGLLIAGERLTVRVKAPFNSPLFPDLELVDPDGLPRPLDLKARGIGKQVSLKGFDVDRTGPWIVRVLGKIGTEGPYTVAFKVRKAPKVKLKNQGLGTGVTAVIPVEAVHGSVLSVTAKWSKKSSPVEIRSVRGPDDQEVFLDGQPAVAAARTKGRKTSLSGVVLTHGHGVYQVTFAAPGGIATFDARLKVTIPDRPRGAKTLKLSSAEPFMDERPFLLRGVEGIQVRISGRNFTFPGTATVLFGENPGFGTRTDLNGTIADVTVPEGVDDTTVRVAVVNADGQGFERQGFFYYVPPPTVTAVESPDGTFLAGGTTAGGTRIRVRGTFFQTGVLVRIGEGASVIPQILDSSTLEFRTPPGVPGRANVLVFDTFEHEAFLQGVFEYKTPPTFDPEPFDPAVVDESGTTRVTVFGTGFALGDQVLFDGEDVSSVPGPNAFSFVPPSRVDGTYTVTIRDRVGTVVDGPDLRVKAPGVIDTVTVTGGPVLGVKDVALSGGATLQIDGEHFHPSDVVTIGGRIATRLSGGDSMVTVLVPPGVPGDGDVVVTDVPGRVATVTAAVRYVGYTDETGGRTPGGSSTDDLSALRGATGDLDEDGDPDDLVLVSFNTSVGTRKSRTRVFVGDGGVLEDVTDDDFPDTQTNDDWNAGGVALGDLDDGDGLDVVIAGTPDIYDDVTMTADYTLGEVRVFTNDGAGSFTRAAAMEPPSTYVESVVATDELSTDHVVLDKRLPQGRPSSVAIGDLDGDGDPDVVVGRTSYEYIYVGLDTDPVTGAPSLDLLATPPYVSSLDAITYALTRYEYFPATRVFLNDETDGNALDDVTATSMPSVGDSDDTTPLPAFHARDLALADLDDDGDLDLVVTWDDPTTVTATGLSTSTAADSPRVATRILLNDGDGVFTDDTATVLPAGVSPEFFQAHRVAVVDLLDDPDTTDDDDLPDIVLLHETGVDAFQSAPAFTRAALRILHNRGDSATPRFADVTAQVLPPITAGSENFRGSALRVGDVDGDGTLDVLIGSSTALTGVGGTTVRSTRLFIGRGFTFVQANAFLPPVTTDSGEASDLLLGDLAGNDDPSLFLIGVAAPATSAGSETLRVFDWHR